MIDVGPENLLDEAESAVTYRELITDVSKQRIIKYASQAYRRDWMTGEDNHENVFFNYMQTFLPRMVYTNPTVDLKTAMPGSEYETQVKALQDALRQWIEDVDLSEFLGSVAENMPFDFGVALVSLESRPGYEHDVDFQDPRAPDLPPLRPKLTMISPTRYFVDPRATHYRHRRFEGHIWWQDRDALISAKDADGKPLFNRREVMESSTSTRDEDDFQRTDMDRVDRRSGPYRDMVMGYEIFVPERGMIYTLARSRNTAESGKDRAVYLRPPRQYWGDPEGPYVMFGIHNVPGQVLPMSVFAAIDTAVEELNQHLGQASDDAGNAKRLILVDSAYEDIEDIVTNAPNGAVVAIPGLSSGLAQPVEIGGVQKANIEWAMHLSDRLDRTMGLTQTEQGDITGATATEINKATGTSDERVSWQQLQFRRCVVKLLKKALWLMHNEPNVVFPVPVEDDKGQIMGTGMFVGGPQDEVPHMPFETLAIKIRPYSMELVDPGMKQRRALQLSEITVKLMEAWTVMPFIKVQAILDDVHEAFNTDGADRYVDWEMAWQFLGMKMQSEAAALQGEQQQGQPAQKALPPGQVGENADAGRPTTPMDEIAGELAAAANAA